MNLAHTPAPWDIEYSARNYWYIEHAQGGETYTLTKLDCGAADARLMAASPDLLASLREIVAAIESDDADGYSPSGDWFREAKAAIAKATGELV